MTFANNAARIQISDPMTPYQHECLAKCHTCVCLVRPAKKVETVEVPYRLGLAQGWPMCQLAAALIP